MRRLQLLRSTQRKKALAPQTHLRSLSSFQDASTRFSSSQKLSMVLQANPNPRRRLRLAPADPNITGHILGATSSRSISKRSKALRGRGSHAAGKGEELPDDLPYTEAKIKADPLFPTRSDLPKRLCARRDPFIDTKGVLYNELQNKFEAKVLETKKRTSYGAEFTVDVTSANSAIPPLQAVGQGRNPLTAARAAWLHVLLILHQKKLFSLLDPPKVGRISNEVASQEKAALLDVYNYCARYDQFPIIERSQQKLRNKRQACTTTISFPAQNIVATASGPSWALSETIAAVQFKAVVERFHANQGTESLTVKSNDSLNAENASEFFVFLRMRKSGIGKPVIDERELPDARQVFEAKVFLGGKPVGPPVAMSNKKRLQAAAHLAAAIEIVQQEPDLKTGFLEALRQGQGRILLPVLPMDCPIDDTAVMLMRDTLAKARQNGLSDRYEALAAEELDEDPTLAFATPARSREELRTRNSYLTRLREKYLTSENVAELRKLRDILPMNQQRSEVLSIVEDHVFSIIIGETGSGKTTQVPQILLDHFTDKGDGSSCNVICTQPRRIAATSVAQRVASERGEPFRASIGYQVRGDISRAEHAGSVNYCTTGILLAQLQNNPERVMDRTSHIILDEVHERDKYIDYTMIILKEVIASRLKRGLSVPKVVLMSATLDASIIAPYFKNRQGDGTLTEAPVLRVPGRTFPVKEQYLDTIYPRLKQLYPSFAGYIATDKDTQAYLEYEREFGRANPVPGEATGDFAAEQGPTKVIDWKRTQVRGDEPENLGENEDRLIPIRLVAAQVAHIAQTSEEGAILTFLPGWAEIEAVRNELLSQKPLGVDFNDEKYTLYTLHSGLATEDRLFAMAPPGKRKIILSTNIAETSVTIPDVQHVIDCGKSRETQYDQTKRMTSLVSAWASKSETKQRAGRAGRVTEGNYYALYSKPRLHALRPVRLPELLRTDLQDVCLDIVSQKWPTPPREFLAAALEPPNATSVDNALIDLQKIDAITADEELTPLGRFLSTLPLHPELGKMVVMGMIFKCLDPMVILGAAASSRPLFVMPQANMRAVVKEKMRKFMGDSNSDHIAVLNAYREVRALRRIQGIRAAKDFCFDNAIHWGAYTTIESTSALLENALMQARVIPIISPNERVKHQYGDSELNMNSSRPHVVKALLAAGLYPQLAVKGHKSLRFWRTQSEIDVMASHASLALASEPAKDTKDLGPPGPKSPQFAVFDTLGYSPEGNMKFIRQNTLISPLAAALFCGHLSAQMEAGRTSTRVVAIDKWLPLFLQTDDRLAVRTIIELRKGMERMLVRAYADLSKQQLLTDDPVRTIFADGVVDILGLDTSEYGPQQLRRLRRDEEVGVFDRMQRSLGRTENRPTGSVGALRSSSVRKSSAGPREDKAMSLGMLEWAAKWEARARAKAEAEGKGGAQRAGR